MELKNYKKHLPKDIIKQAEKMLVRELDEVKPSQYESYVDDGDETYDVKIAIGKTGAILKNACDCEDGKTSLCAHKAAVIITLAENKKIGSKTKVTKVKVNPTQLLMQEVDATLLKDWVLELLQKNKDLELAFTLKFTQKPTSYTKEEVIKITETAYKAVVKTKKNIDQTELKKLIELWGQAHEPIITCYTNDLLVFENFEHLITISTSCREYYFKLNINTVKIHNYVLGLLLKTLEPLNNFMNEDNWLKVANYFVNAISDSNKMLREYFFIYCIKLVEISSQPRKEVLIDLIVKKYKDCQLHHLYDGDHPTKKLLDVVETSDLFNKYYDIFKPIVFDNTFNVKLINTLVDNNYYEIAEKYCKAQIAGNYREEYNTYYLKILKLVYSKTDNKIGLKNVCTQLLPLTFDFDDYLFIINLIPDENEQKEFRNKMYTKARSTGRNGGFNADRFCFQLLDMEKKYLKMIELIGTYTTFATIVEYFEGMFFAKKEYLIKAIFNKPEPWMHMNYKEENEEQVYINLYEKIKKHYGEVFTDLAFKPKTQGFYRNDNKFVRYVQDKLIG